MDVAEAFVDMRVEVMKAMKCKNQTSLYKQKAYVLCYYLISSSSSKVRVHALNGTHHKLIQNRSVNMIRKTKTCVI